MDSSLNQDRTAEQWIEDFGDIEHEFKAETTLKLNVGLAVDTVIEAMGYDARHSSSPTEVRPVSRLEFEAAKYVIERVLGKPKDTTKADNDANIDRLLKKVAEG